MKGVDVGGVGVESRRAEERERSDVLRDLDVATLRRLLIRIMNEGGVPRDRQVEVMRTSRSRLYHDISGTTSKATADGREPEAGPE